MRLRAFVALLGLLLLRCSELLAQSPAVVAVDRAIERLGGATTLRKIERVRFEQMTLWHRQTFEDRPYGDVVGSYERVSDLRDYTIPAWRNTRRFISGNPNAFEVVDLVRDSVATRYAPTQAGAPAWGALNIAYLDERRELFAFAPERLLLAARDARDLKTLPDTTIDGVVHQRVSATIDRYPSTIFLRQSTGFPAMVRYRAAHPNDFGLAPFGVMEVELWFGQWRTIAVAGGLVTYPLQWDITRIGRPYKRITVLGARFDIAASPDSFVVSDETRTKYRATDTRAMWDVPLDSGRIIDGRFAILGPLGPSPAAVKVGTRWILLEGGSVPDRVEPMQRWLGARDPGTSFGGMLITAPGAARGEIAWFARERRPVYLGPGAQRGARIVLANWGQPTNAPDVVARGRWIRVDGDSLWLEPVDVPGSPGSVVAWVPSLRWMYHSLAIDPLVKEILMQLARQRGWSVERLGHARAVSTPVAPSGATR